MLEEINRKIQEKTHKSIIINVFNYLVDNHKDCNCSYCKLKLQMEKFTIKKDYVAYTLKYDEKNEDLLRIYNELYYEIIKVDYRIKKEKQKSKLC